MPDVDGTDAQVDTCSNGQRDLDESDVDCGGPCAPCATGKACVQGGDCVSGVCSVFVCRDAGCGNGVQDGDETGSTAAPPARPASARGARATPSALAAALVETEYGKPNHSEVAERLYPTEDGGFLIVGYTHTSNHTTVVAPKGWVVRLDAQGAVVWQHELDPPAGRTELELRAARARPSGGFWVVGVVRGGRSGDRGWLAELGASGTVTWSKEVAQVGRLDHILPIAGSEADSLVVGVSGSSGWFARLGATGDLVWSKTGGQALAPFVAALNDGRFVVGASSFLESGTWLQLVSATGTVKELPLAETWGQAAAGLDTGGFVVAGRDQTAQFKPQLVRFDAQGDPIGVEQPEFTGYWTAVDARPGGGVVLGGLRNYAAGWNPLVLGLGDAGGQLAFHTFKRNVNGNELYAVRMNDAVVRPTGGYAWLATTDESYTSTYKTARLYRVTCDGGDGPPPPSSVVISEVLYDAPGSDDDTFIELRGPAGTSLEGYTLVGINGNGGAAYKTVTLTGTIPADGVYLVANTTAGAWIAQHAEQTADVDLQNGPDSVQLRDPSGNVLDALGYGDFTGWVFAGEGTPAPLTNPGESLTRDADATDTNNNAVDFKVSKSPTPGAP